MCFPLFLSLRLCLFLSPPGPAPNSLLPSPVHSSLPSFTRLASLTPFPLCFCLLSSLPMPPVLPLPHVSTSHSLPHPLFFTVTPFTENFSVIYTIFVSVPTVWFSSSLYVVFSRLFVCLVIFDSMSGIVFTFSFSVLDLYVFIYM